MNESRELFFSDVDQKMYGRLDAAFQDLGSANAYAEFVLKKGWKAKPWGRGSTYLQQSAFMTALVTSYCRAFTRSRGWPDLPSHLVESYDASERTTHDEIKRLRNQVYAHSDSVSYGIRPWKSDLHSDIYQHPIFEIDHEMIRRLRAMCSKMMNMINNEKASIKLRYL